jgi:hypothetical protein
VTLDTHSDLFDTDLDAVAVTLHARYSRQNVGNVWAQGASDDPTRPSENAFTSMNGRKIGM